MNMMFIFAQGNESSTPEQIKNRFYFGVEAGIKTFDYRSRDYSFIREEATYFYGNYENYSQIASMTYMPIFVLKAEYRMLSDKIWLSGGVDYSFMNSSQSRISQSQYDTDYLYVLLNQDQNDTYYYRVKEVEARDQYIGIPIDIRYSPFLPRFFRLYFKLGFDVNFKIASKQNVVFHDSEMNTHEEDILNLFDESKPFYSTGSLGVGFQLGKQDKPNFRIEADFPTIVITPEAFALMDHSFGGGVRMSFVLPLKSN